MNDNFYRKTGIAITCIARDLMGRSPGERMPIIQKYQEMCDLSRGTVQNALKFLKEAGAVSYSSRGHLGTFIDQIDFGILQGYAVDGLTGTMPLPYSLLYEGFATGLYENMQKSSVNLRMAYMRGSRERIQCLADGIYQFAVVSRYAAKTAAELGQAVRPVMDFGAYSYLSRHIMLFAKPGKTAIEDGMLVGLDPDSYDHCALTREMTRGKHVKYINMPGNQQIYALTAGLIDVGIWNYDEIREKNYQNLTYSFLEESQMEADMSAAVILCRTEDDVTPAILKKNLSEEGVLDIQQKVLQGEMIPHY